MLIQNVSIKLFVLRQPNQKLQKRNKDARLDPMACHEFYL